MTNNSYKMNEETIKKTNQCLRCLKSRNMIILIVFIAITLDNVLLTTIVPIIPELLHFNRSSLQHNCTDDNCSNSGNHSVDDLHIKIGIMFTIKPLVQLIVNPFIGLITNRIGYTIPMFTGFVILFASTILFAFGNNYYLLLVARAVQGVGSACSSVSGMGMLASYFVDEVERGRAFALALSGLAIGVLIGPPYGGATYQFISREAPFLILAACAMIDGLLQLLALKPAVQRENQEGSSLLDLLKDPYILIAAGSITFGNMGIAVIEPTLPLWMKTTMNSTEWQQGVVFLPASISYLVGANIFGPISHRIGRGNSAGLGLVINAGCLVAIPFVKRMEHLIAPMFGIGFAIGMVDSSMMPIMGYLVDLRHTAVYGSVYAIADVGFCIGFVVGPVIGTSLVKAVGFKWMIWIIAIVCFVYAPLTLFLRKVQKKNDSSLEITVCKSIDSLTEQSSNDE